MFENKKVLMGNAVEIGKRVLRTIKKVQLKDRQKIDRQIDRQIDKFNLFLFL